MRKRFHYILLKIAFLIIAIEGFSRLAFVLLPPETLWEEEDYSWRRIWITRHQQTGKEGLYNFDAYDPSKGWISKPNLRNIKVFNNKVLNTNSKGLRGIQEYSYGNHPKKLRIIVLGDSFTFGDEVSDDETFPHYLQGMLPSTEIINMGVHGYAHDQMLIFLKEEGIKYKPDIVILGYRPIAISRNLLKFRDYAKPMFVLNEGELKLTNASVPPPKSILKWDWARPRTFHILSILSHRYKKSSGLLKKEEEEVTTALFNEIAKLTNSINAILVFVYMPSGIELSDKVAMAKDEKFFFSICNKIENVHCLSTRPHFEDKIAKGLSLMKSGHWEPAGHLTAAEAIKHFLIDGGYVYSL